MVVSGAIVVSLSNDPITKVIEDAQSVVGENLSLFYRGVYILKKGVNVLKTPVKKLKVSKIGSESETNPGEI